MQGKMTPEKRKRVVQPYAVKQRTTSRISNATVYDAIAALEKGVTLRMFQLQEGINSVGERMTKMDERMTKHDERHTINERASVVGTEIKLDAKKVGVLSVLASVAVIVASAVKELAGKQGWLW